MSQHPRSLTLAQLHELKGQAIGTSTWRTVSQEEIDTFAKLTGDMQWIHVDVPRSAAESPHGTTIAHGFLTLSLIPGMIGDVVSIADAGVTLNYGLNRVRFPAVLPSGSRIRGQVVLSGMEQVIGGVQIAWMVSIERQGGNKPVCVAELLTRVYL